MYPIKRLMIGIDQSPMDDLLLKFTAGFASLTDIDKVYIIHAARNLELPEPLTTKYPDLIAPVDENIFRETTQSINKFFPSGLKSRTEMLVLEGNPFQTILKETVVKEIDLVVMGKKSKPASTGVLARKLTLLGNCSMAIVPRNFKPEKDQNMFRKILVPVDFSEHSRMAAEMAGELAGRASIRIDCQYIYRVPPGYNYSAKSLKELSKLVVDNAKKEMGELLKKARLHPEKVKQVFTYDEHQDIPGMISLAADRNHYDLVVMGSQGRTAAASILLGSNAEKVIDLVHVPVLVMKDKHHNLGLVEALLNM